ncbi:MAG: DNA polymerase III subunit delta, partial [Parasphingopyxis sp.]
VTIAIQVNGKLRDTLTVAKGASKPDLEALALASEKVARQLDGSAPKKVIVVPDRSGSEALAAGLGEAMGADAERIDLTGDELRGDPARLADEAASISLFGTPRYIRVEAKGDEILAAVDGLLEAAQAGNPVVILAGALRPTSRLVKRVYGDDRAMGFASYAPEDRDADRLVIAMGQKLGLQINPDIARMLDQASAGDRAILAGELQKFASYLDAAPDRPRRLEQDALDAVGAAIGEGDMSGFADIVLTGDLRQLDSELNRLASEGVEGIPLIRAVLRRLLQLAGLRAEVERGDSIPAVIQRAGRSIFWKDKQTVASELGIWKSDTLANAVTRMMSAERTLKSSGGAGLLAANTEILAVARHARRMR